MIKDSPQPAGHPPGLNEAGLIAATRGENGRGAPERESHAQSERGGDCAFNICLTVSW